MAEKILRRLKSVFAAELPFTLRVQWEDGDSQLVDVSAPLEQYRFYRPLREQAELFAQMQIGEYGTDVVWPGGIDMAADLIWHLAQKRV